METGPPILPTVPCCPDSWLAPEASVTAPYSFSHSPTPAEPEDRPPSLPGSSTPQRPGPAPGSRWPPTSAACSTHRVWGSACHNLRGPEGGRGPLASHPPLLNSQPKMQPAPAACSKPPGPGLLSHALGLAPLLGGRTSPPASPNGGARPPHLLTLMTRRGLLGLFLSR